MADANMYVLNPVFKADTFQEMVAPLTLYAQAYKEQEAKVEDMTDKAAALEWIANQNPDSQTAALYKDMSTKIQGLRDDIMTNGLTGGLRSRILGTRRMYSANSAEITRRYEDMLKYQQRMEQLYDKDNSIVFSPESQNVSLDDFAGGKRPQIKAISGNEIMARGAAAGKRFTSQIFGDGVEGKIMGDQFWRVYKEQGMTDQALANALASINQGDKYPMLKQVMDGVYSSFADFNPVDQQVLKNKFMEGFYSGAVYNRDTDYKNNEAFIDPYKAALIRWGDAENAREAESHEAEMKDWRFARGDTRRLINGRWILVDPTTNSYVDVTDLVNGTSKTTTSTPIPAAKKDTSKKQTQQSSQKTEKKVVLSADGNGNRRTATNNQAQGKPVSSTDKRRYEKGVKSIAAAHPDTTEADLKNNYNIYYDQENNRYYAEPKQTNASSPTTSTDSSAASSTTSGSNRGANEFD